MTRLQGEALNFTRIFLFLATAFSGSRPKCTRTYNDKTTTINTLQNTTYFLVVKYAS